VLGREVAALVNEHLPPGTYEKTFDAEGLPSGVYFYRIEAMGVGSAFTQVKKMLLVR
jgi:hypothetical protein